MGFFELTRTGDITSRLASDTTTMSDQVSLNLNVLMRSIVQMVIVLWFMFASSWKLTCLTFTMVPFTVMLSKSYGMFYRKVSEARRFAKKYTSQGSRTDPPVTHRALDPGWLRSMHAYSELQEGLRRVFSEHRQV